MSVHIAPGAPGLSPTHNATSPPHECSCRTWTPASWGTWSPCPSPEGEQSKRRKRQEREILDKVATRHVTSDATSEEDSKISVGGGVPHTNGENPTVAPLARPSQAKRHKVCSLSVKECQKEMRKKTPLKALVKEIANDQYDGDLMPAEPGTLFIIPK